MTQRDREALGAAAYRQAYDPQPPLEGDACEAAYTYYPSHRSPETRTLECDLPAGHAGPHETEGARWE